MFSESRKAKVFLKRDDIYYRGGYEMKFEFIRKDNFGRVIEIVSYSAPSSLQAVIDSLDIATACKLLDGACELGIAIRVK